MPEVKSQEQMERLRALAEFKKLTAGLSKITEAPVNVQYGFSSSSIFSDDFTIDDIIEAKNDLNIEKMREISNFYYKTSSSYRRILNYFSYLYKYYYVLDLKHLGMEVANKKNQIESIKKTYMETLDFLDSLNIEDTFGFIATRMLVDGAFYGYLNFFDNNKVTITMLDPNFCTTRYKSAYGTNIVEFNVKFFEKYKDEKELAQVLKSFPKEVQAGWRKFQKEGGGSGSQKPYVMLPPETSCAFQFGGVDIPPFFDSIIDIINFNDYKDIEKRRDSQQLEKILVHHFDMDEDGDPSVFLEEMSAMHEATCNMLQENPYINILTTYGDVQLLDAQSNSSSVTNNNIDKMMVPKYENAGLSFELFSSTTATSLELSISNSTSFMSQAITSFSVWLSMICLSRFNYKKLEPVVTILPITWYNDKRLLDMYLKQAQSGYSFMLPYVASGKKQSTLLDVKTLENDILGLQDLLIPLQNSYTQSSEEGSRQKGDIQEKGIDPVKANEGRPTKDLDEKSEKTVKNINAGG